MHVLNSICCGVYLLLLVRHALQLFFPKSNTCDFKSNLHCMLIWFWNHTHSCIISDQITLYSVNIPLYMVLLLMGETEHLMNSILSHRSGNQLLKNIPCFRLHNECCKWFTIFKILYGKMACFSYESLKFPFLL